MPMNGLTKLQKSPYNATNLLKLRKVIARSKKNADIVVEWLPEQAVQRMVRRIHNTFWFFREVRQYGRDCEIVRPQDVRDRFIEDLESAIGLYREQ